MTGIVPPNIGQFLGVDYFALIFIISSLLIVIHFGFVALSYMASKILSNNSLEGFSKHELQQAVFSAIILGSIFMGILVINNLFCVVLSDVGFASVCTVPSSFSFQEMNGVAHINVARSKLGMFYNDVRVLAKGALRAYDWTEFFSKLKGGSGLFKSSVPFFAHSGVHAAIYSECFDILSNVLVFLKFQELLMFMNSVYFFPPFLYLGLILRILPFTRKLGGLILGITLSLFFVLPYLYIAGWIILEATPGFGTKYIVDSSAFVFTVFSFNVMGGSNVDGEKADLDISEYAKEQLFKDLQADKELSNTLLYSEELFDENGELKENVEIGLNSEQGKYEGSKNMYGDSKDYLTKREERRNNSFVEIVARVVLSIVFITVFALVGTISAVKEISMFFGGDVEIAGLTRLI